jgi:hypothetical protein
MKTIREQIIELIVARLETITISNGYENNIGIGRVYREEAVIKQGIAPAISVWELSETRQRNSYGGTVRTLRIKVEGVVGVNGDKHPATASNQLLGDIERALILCDTSLDVFIDDIQDVAAEIAQITSLQGNTTLAGATVDFEIQYTTEWGDPYTQ